MKKVYKDKSLILLLALALLLASAIGEAGIAPFPLHLFDEHSPIVTLKHGKIHVSLKHTVDTEDHDHGLLEVRHEGISQHDHGTGHETHLYEGLSGTIPPIKRIVPHAPALQTFFLQIPTFHSYYSYSLKAVSPPGETLSIALKKTSVLLI